MPPNKILIYKGEKSHHVEKHHQINQQWETHNRDHRADALEKPSILRGVSAKDAQPESDHEATSKPKPRQVFKITGLEFSQILR